MSTAINHDVVPAPVGRVQIERAATAAGLAKAACDIADEACRLAMTCESNGQHQLAVDWANVAMFCAGIARGHEHEARVALACGYDHRAAKRLADQAEIHAANAKYAVER